MKLSRPEQYNTLILLLILHLAAGGGRGPQSAPHPTNVPPPPHSNSYSYFRQIREGVKRVSSASQLAIFEILKFILGVEAYGNETNENALRCSYAKVHFFCFNPLSLKPSMNRLFPKSKIFHILNESKSFKYAS